MPPKVQFTKEQIIDSALAIARKEGINSLTVRKVAAELGCSVAPIYVNFKNSDEMLQALIERIGEISWKYSIGEYTKIGFFNIGIGQILFAKDYPLLFMDLMHLNHQCLEVPADALDSMVDIMMKDKMLDGLTREQNADLLQKMSLFTSGLSIAMLKSSQGITLERALTLIEETAHQLIHSYRHNYQDSYTPHPEINLPE